MKLPRNIASSVGIILSIVALAGPAWSAEQSAPKEESSKKSSSKSLSQTVEEVRNSINEGWRKLTNPKTVEPARDSVNEGWRKITDPKTVEPARQEINKAWKGLSDAAGAAVRPEKKPQPETRDKKDK